MEEHNEIDVELEKLLLFTVNKIRYQKQKPSLERILPKITKTTQYDENMVKTALSEMVKNSKLLKVETKKGYSYRDPYKDPLTNFSTSNANKYKGLQKKRQKSNNAKTNTSSKSLLSSKLESDAVNNEEISEKSCLTEHVEKPETSKKNQFLVKKVACKNQVNATISISNQTKAILKKAKGIKPSKSRKLTLSPSKHLDVSSKKNLLSPSKVKLPIITLVPKQAMFQHKTIKIEDPIKVLVMALDVIKFGELKNLEDFVSTNYYIQGLNGISLKVFIRNSCKKAVRSNKVVVKDGLYSLPDVTENVKEQSSPLVCSYCFGTSQCNTMKEGTPEPLITCDKCGKTGHATCMKLPVDLFLFIQDGWKCIECKTCVVCNKNNISDKFVFCSLCDQAYHENCLPETTNGNMNLGCSFTCTKCEEKRKNPILLRSNQGNILSPLGGSGQSKKKNLLKVAYNKKSVTLIDGMSRFFTPSLSGRKTMTSQSRKIQLVVTPPDLDDDFIRTKKKRRNTEKRESKIARKNRSFSLVQASTYKGDAAMENLSTPPREIPKITSKDQETYEQAIKKAQKKTELNRLKGDLIDPLETRCPNSIQFGKYNIDTWFSSPYPKKYAQLHKLYVCEFCLHYMDTPFTLLRHKQKCRWKHPPGNEIYRCNNLSVWEVEGKKCKIYCQNVCMLAKLFLDSKTLFYDVEPFLFYVLTVHDSTGEHFIGYFSKERDSSLAHNVSCIMTMPQYQRQGYGRFLIDFSYLLTKRERKVGGPETPLSPLGAISYNAYWKYVILEYFYNKMKSNNNDGLDIRSISLQTGIHHNSISDTLVKLKMLKVKYQLSNSKTPEYEFLLNKKVLEEHAIKRERHKDKPRVDPEQLMWMPFGGTAAFSSPNSDRKATSKAVIQAEENQSSPFSIEDEAQKENENELSSKMIKQHSPIKLNNVLEPLKTSPPPKNNSINNFSQVLPDVIPSSQKEAVSLSEKPITKKKKRRKRKPNGFDYGRVPKKKIKKNLLPALDAPELNCRTSVELPPQSEEVTFEDFKVEDVEQLSTEAANNYDSELNKSMISSKISKNNNNANPVIQANKLFGEGKVKKLKLVRSPAKKHNSHLKNHQNEHEKWETKSCHDEDDKESEDKVTEIPISPLSRNEECFEMKPPTFCKPKSKLVKSPVKNTKQTTMFKFFKRIPHSNEKSLKKSPTKPACSFLGDCPQQSSKNEHLGETNKLQVFQKKVCGFSQLPWISSSVQSSNSNLNNLPFIQAMKPTSLLAKGSDFVTYRDRNKEIDDDEDREDENASRVTASPVTSDTSVSSESSVDEEVENFTDDEEEVVMNTNKWTSSYKLGAKSTAEAFPALQQSVMTSAPLQSDSPENFVLKQPMLVGTKNKVPYDVKNQKEPENLPLSGKRRPEGERDKIKSDENSENQKYYEVNVVKNIITSEVNNGFEDSEPPMSADDKPRKKKKKKDKKKYKKKKKKSKRHNKNEQDLSSLPYADKSFEIEVNEKKTESNLNQDELTAAVASITSPIQVSRASPLQVNQTTEATSSPFDDEENSSLRDIKSNGNSEAEDLKATEALLEELHESNSNTSINKTIQNSPTTFQNVSSFKSSFSPTGIENEATIDKEAVISETNQDYQLNNEKTGDAIVKQSSEKEQFNNDQHQVSISQQEQQFDNDLRKLLSEIASTPPSETVITTVSNNQTSSRPPSVTTHEINDGQPTTEKTFANISSESLKDNLVTYDDKNKSFKKSVQSPAKEFNVEAQPNLKQSLTINSHCVTKNMFQPTTPPHQIVECAPVIGDKFIDSPLDEQRNDTLQKNNETIQSSSNDQVFVTSSSQLVDTSCYQTIEVQNNQAMLNSQNCFIETTRSVCNSSLTSAVNQLPNNQLLQRQQANQSVRSSSASQLALEQIVRNQALQEQQVRCSSVNPLMHRPLTSKNARSVSQSSSSSHTIEHRPPSRIQSPHISHYMNSMKPKQCSMAAPAQAISVHFSKAAATKSQDIQMVNQMQARQMVFNQAHVLQMTQQQLPQMNASQIQQTKLQSPRAQHSQTPSTTTSVDFSSSGCSGYETWSNTSSSPFTPDNHHLLINHHNKQPLAQSPVCTTHSSAKVPMATVADSPSSPKNSKSPLVPPSSRQLVPKANCFKTTKSAIQKTPPSVTSSVLMTPRSKARSNNISIQQHYQEQVMRQQQIVAQQNHSMVSVNHRRKEPTHHLNMTSQKRTKARKATKQPSGRKTASIHQQFNQPAAYDWSNMYTANGNYQQAYNQQYCYPGAEISGFHGNQYHEWYAPGNNYQQPQLRSNLPSRGTPLMNNQHLQGNASLYSNMYQQQMVPYQDTNTIQQVGQQQYNQQARQHQAHFYQQYQH